jgi:hypothetical protein
MEQQNKLESEIHQIQEKREAERMKLMEQLQEGQYSSCLALFLVCVSFYEVHLMNE